MAGCGRSAGRRGGQQLRGERRARVPPLRLPGQRSQPGAHLPRYRRAGRAARTQHLFTYCRASETSCRCPARTIRTKSRSVLVDKLLDPLPPVYNIGHSCNRGQKRSPEKNEKSGLAPPGGACACGAAPPGEAGPGPCGTLRGCARPAPSGVSAPPRSTKPGYPGPPHHLCAGAASHWPRCPGPAPRISLARPPRRARPGPAAPTRDGPARGEGS